MSKVPPSLGAELSVGSASATAIQRERLDKGKSAAQKLERIHAPRDAKLTVAQGKVIPMVTYWVRLGNLELDGG